MATPRKGDGVGVEADGDGAGVDVRRERFELKARGT
jgi:hypothetical protein